MKINIDNSLSQTQETQTAISSNFAIDLLKAGNTRFIKNIQLSRNYNQQINQTTSGQYPFAIVLSCIDSRVPTDIIFDQGIGDIFSVSVAGNFINDDVLGSMEYACKFAGVKLIVVLGHTSCGAIKGACDSLKSGLLTQLLDKLQPAVKTTESIGNDRSSSNLDFVNKVALSNVLLTVNNIAKESQTLNDLLAEGNIKIVPAMYDVSTGEVDFLNK